MPVDGIWDLTIATPIGSIDAVVELQHQDNGILTGSAHGAGQLVPLTDIALHEGGRITWKQAITRPMRLNLTFATTVDGDTMTGTARAGRLPASTVSGRRRPTDYSTGEGPQE